MREYKHGRSRKQQKIDRDQAYDEEEAHVDSKARERFLRKPYTMCCVRQGYTLHPGGTYKGA